MKKEPVGKRVYKMTTPGGAFGSCRSRSPRNRSVAAANDLVEIDPGLEIGRGKFFHFLEKTKIRLVVIVVAHRVSLTGSGVIFEGHEPALKNDCRPLFNNLLTTPARPATSNTL